MTDEWANPLERGLGKPSVHNEGREINRRTCTKEEKHKEKRLGALKCHQKGIRRTTEKLKKKTHSQTANEKCQRELPRHVRRDQKKEEVDKRRYKEGRERGREGGGVCGES